MQVFFRIIPLSNTTHTLDLETDITVEQLREVIFNQFKLCFHAYYFTNGSYFSNCEKKLVDYGIKNESKIDIAIRDCFSPPCSACAGCSTYEETVQREVKRQDFVHQERLELRERLKRIEAEERKAEDEARKKKIEVTKKEEIEKFRKDMEVLELKMKSAPPCYLCSTGKRCGKGCI